MSSYQFVNSLAACYNGGRGGPDPSAANEYYPGAATASSGAGGSGGGAAGATYPNCYSPATAAQANYYGGSPTHHVTNLSNGSDYRTNAPPGLNGGSVLPLTGSLSSNPSCKYASSALNNNNNNNNNNSGANNPNNIVSSGGGSGASTNAVVAAAAAAAALVGLETGLANCGSPQDLTTNSNGSSASSSVCSTPRSPPLGSGGSSTGGRSQSQSNSSHNSTSPNSNNGSQSQSGNNTKGSGNPPQIYPWMKRVHLGQSKQNGSTKFSSLFHINL